MSSASSRPFAMVNVPVFCGEVSEDGTLQLPDLARRALTRYIRTLKGKSVDVVVKVRKDVRSVEQLKYWWAIPVPLCAEHCGYTESQMHYALLGECFGYTVGPTGQPVPNKPSSSDLSVDEFAHLITWVLDWAPTELGVFIPEPDKHWRQKKVQAA